MRIGLARVSTKDQNLDLQLHALEAYRCQKIFQEKSSGLSKNRPVLAAALRALRPGDSLVVWDLDRLGRDARYLINLYYDLLDRGIEVVSLTEAIKTETPEGEHAFFVACADAQRESRKISRRTKAAMGVAKANGVRLGRPRLMTPARIRKARKLLDRDKSVPQVARSLAVSRTTLWRALDRTAA